MSTVIVVKLVKNCTCVQTIGNHEWDKGLDAFKRYIDKLNTTHEAILGANIDFGGHQLEEKIKRYVVKTVKGKKVCNMYLSSIWIFRVY